MNDDCMSCGLPITGVQYHSLVYMAPTNGLLCEFCHKTEEACEERAGTNDLPQLRDLYNSAMRSNSSGH